MSGGTLDVSKAGREILSVMVSFEQNPKISGAREAWMAIWRIFWRRAF